jgi:hypothetical protein
MEQVSAQVMQSAHKYDPQVTRAYLQKRGLIPENFVRYSYRPFDIRWLYWEAETDLLHREVEPYFRQLFDKNVFLFTTGKTRKPKAEPPIVTSFLNDLNCMDSGARGFPLYLERHVLLGTGKEIREHDPNLTTAAKQYLERLQVTPEDLFHHCLAIMHAQQYRTENADALRQDWPRIPLPADATVLRRSAALGQKLAALLDSHRSVEGVTTGIIQPELLAIGTITKADISAGTPDLEVRARWGYYTNGKTMPGTGKTTVRAFNPEEETVLGQHNLGEQAVDVYLNDTAYWRCVPSNVWAYTLGGYQVIKKWLSYREYGVLKRALTVDEVREVTATARRIAAILLLEPELEANYRTTQR